MEVKTDTKEKFTVIRVKTEELSATMAAELDHQLQELRKGTPGNIVLNLSDVKNISEEGAEVLVRTQQKFYDSDLSFVVCELDKDVEDFLDNNNLLELMNVTPTESEAFDIVQMEEIERELLDEEDDPSSPGA
ncbi:MAG: STAS domain-containing protein [Bacteroidota bacterium]|nr:STAS domain-containing protein [Bacteroidota bacterium]